MECPILVVQVLAVLYSGSCSRDLGGVTYSHIIGLVEGHDDDRPSEKENAEITPELEIIAEERSVPGG